MARLAAAGALLAALLALLVALVAAPPAGFDVPYGLSRGALALYRGVWPLPAPALAPAAWSASVGAVVAALFAVYLVSVALAQRGAGAGERRRLALVVLVVAALCDLGLGALAPPVLSNDVLHYGAYGRMVAHHGLNPYVTSPGAVPGDPFFPYVAFNQLTTRYGPLWTLLSSAVAAAGGGHVLRTVVLFKALAALSHLGAALLVQRTARTLVGGDGLEALALFAWNPLVLVEVAGSGHNDALMVALALVGLLCAARGRLLAAVAALTASALIKYLTGLALLFVVARAVAAAGTRRAAVVVATRCGLLAAGLAALAYLPFWWSAAGPAAALGAAAPGLNTMPNPIFRALSAVAVRLAGPRLAGPLLVLALHVGFAALLARWLAARAAWPALLRRWGAASLLYVVVVHGASYPWYLTTPLAAAALTPGAPPGRRPVTLVLTLALALASMLLYARLVPAGPR